MKFETFSKKQTIALTWWLKNSPYEKFDAIICDGSIRSGKTICMSISFVLWAFYKFNGSAFAICGKTIKSIKRNVLTPILPILTSLGFTFKKKLSENLIEISFEQRTNIFYLFGGKDESSASLIQGMTLAGVLFDEVALMPKSFVEQALARCSVCESKFWFNCNPEYPGHWFYRDWILKKEVRGAMYLHFTMDDNPSLSSLLKERYKRLYTGTFYQRFIEGRWVAVEGLIYPYMSESSMFCDLPSSTPTRYALSCDYGIVNPTSCGLWAEIDGVWFRVDEYYYDSRKEGETRTDEEHYKYIRQMVGSRQIDCMTIDPSAASFITLVRKHGEFKVIPARNNVSEGIAEVTLALKRGDIKVCKNCVNSIREFSLYRWQNSSSKDTPVKENDHAMDDIRYFVSTVMAADDDPFFALAAQR
nr:MAG TPA: large terminase [Caudoviricetes sp.]